MIPEEPATTADVTIASVSREGQAATAGEGDTLDETTIEHNDEVPWSENVEGGPQG